MTVRVNKSSFNIREKLSELGRKFGLKGSELAAAETVQEARDLVSAGRKNYFINGSALVWQRGTSGISNSAYNNYGCDRWWLANGATSVDRSTTVPSGFQYSMKYTSNGGSSTVGQAIELTATGVSQFEAGKEYTMSVWARTDSGESNLTFIVFYRNSKYSGTNQVNWNPYAPTVGKMTTEWKKFTYTFTAPTVNSNNQILATEFSFNKTAYFTGFQFEKGRNATEFEHRSYGEELALCQRYFQNIGTTNFHTWSHDIADTTGMRLAPWNWPGGPMRASPTLSFDDNAGNSSRFSVRDPDEANGGTNISYSITKNQYGIQTAFKYPHAVSGFSKGQSGYAVAYNLTLSAEL